MENISDLQAGYQEHLFNSFEKIKKHLSKKHNQIRDLITTYSEQIKTDKEYNANKYFGVYKLSIETKDTKLVETSIYFIHKLISHGYLDGNCRDSTANLHLEENKGKIPDIPTSEKRKLIDSIVESICSCKDEKAENVLLTIVTSLTCEVHGKSLQEIIKTLFTIHLTSKNNVNQTTAKAALTQIINAIFQRMEEYNLKNNKALEDDYKSRRKTLPITPAKGAQNLQLQRHNSSENNQESINPYPSLSVSASSGSVQNEINLQTSGNDKSPLRRETVSNVSISTNYGDVLPTEIVDGKSNNITEPQEQYISRMLQNMVDDVCLYYGKQEAILKNYETKEDKENLKYELENIPHRAVPLVLNPDDPKYRALIRVPGLVNEVKNPAGYFGWCFVCRGPADLYCKDTRIPICSIECKLKHLDELDFLSFNGNIDYTTKNVYLHDACQIFNYLCKISGKDPANNMTPTILKNKTLALELILSIMDNPGPTFTSRKEFKDIIKDHLCDSILKNSVSTDRPVFAYSLGIFVSLVNQFREQLKSEIAVFVDNVFLKMLESGNSSYHHRLLALQVFYKITSKPKTVLEFYVNYDCDVKSTNITEKIIEILCKIAQGKYLRSEYGTVINPQQEPTLKVLALESLVNLVKSLAQFQEEYKVKQTNHEKVDEKEEGDGSFEAEDPKETTMFEKADEIEKSRMLKTELQKAIQKFGFKIKLGMKYFAQLGVINPEDPVSIGKFFFKTPNLSKEKLGEYFGEEPEFYIKVLTAYTDCFDVRNMSLDDALRVYLSSFYLPGEGQKIDRIMQVFAGKYFADNPNGIFKSASAAYTAAFLFIMLQTDAHNPQIKEQDRMKFPSFVKTAKGINDGENLPEEELQGFYNRIVKTPLALVDSEKNKKMAAEASTHSLKKKEEQFKLESEKMIEEGQELIKKKLETQFFVVAGPEYTKSMFTEIIWSPVFAVFTVLFEQFDDPKIIQLCLEGLANCIKLTGYLNMNTERDTFVSSFAKMTNLTTPNREIKEKNAKAIKSLLQIALTHGQLLRSSWKYVLESISRIDHYLHYTGNRDSDPFANDTNRMSKNEALDHIEAINSEVVKMAVDPNLIHNIFNKSNTFELEEIVEFITCLCKISEDELKNPQGLSIYSLQKLVEVAHFNIDRIKFIWSQIWNIMREHISHVAINSIPEVSLFAVDSLKQLSIKFLKKDEFASLEFQKEFLKPFETIFEKVSDDYIKDLVLNCINYIISHVMKNIKSGWKTILDILSLSAESDKDNLIQLSFDIVEKIIKENLEAMKDVISDLSLLLLKFAKNKQENIAKSSLEYFALLVDQIVINHKTTRTEGDTISTIKEGQEEAPVKKDSKTNLVFGIAESAWINILTSLYTLSSDPRKMVNTKATVIIFDILIKNGADFSHDFWTNIMGGVIKPLFDEIQFSFQSKKASPKDSKDKDTQASKDFSSLAFGKIIELYNKYYDHLSFFTNDIFNILLNCILNPSEVLAKISLSALKDIIARSYKNYEAKEWEQLIELFSRICKSTIPLQLMDQQIINKKAKKPTKFNADECVTQCVVQLQMVGVIKEIISNYFDYFTDEQIDRIIEVLLKSAKFARDFNDQIYLRFCLWKSGFMKEMSQLPGLLKQEKEGFIGYVTVLHKLYLRTTDKEKARKLLDQLLDFGIELMKIFCQKNEDLISIRHEMVAAEATHKDSSDKQEANVEDDYDMVQLNLRSTETERDIVNMRTILSSFVPKLAQLKPEELLPRLRELTNSLINISFFYVPKSLYPLENTQGNQKITDLGSDETVHVIRNLLNKYFDFTFSFIKN